VPVSKIAPAAQPGTPRRDAPPGEELEGTTFLERVEVRDVLAWVRLLVDPHDAAAVVRALARPPVELRQVDLARVIALARRRKLDMVAALGAAIESPQIPPDARERIQHFLRLRSAATEALDARRPDLLTRVVLGAAGEERERSRAGRGDVLEETLRMLREEVLASVARIGGRLGELRLDTDLDISHGVVRYLELLKLAALVRRRGVVRQGGEARLGEEGGEARLGEEGIVEALADINSRLLAATTALQREILQSSPLDEALLAAVSRTGESGPEDDAATPAAPPAGTALPPAAGTAPPPPAGAPAGALHDERALARALAARGEPSLRPFLPRKGMGLALSASDIDTYRTCPLRYKFARVLRIPSAPTRNQRFGIVVHQVLERYHAAGDETLARLLDLLEASWRRSGFGNDEHERALHAKARAALERYHARLHGQDSEPVWFERQFSFRVGPHQLRGRVDRVDRVRGRLDDASGHAGAGGHAGASGHAGGEGGRSGTKGEGRPGGGEGWPGGGEEREEYELIDYKTSRPKTAAQLSDDIQLSLYALAARESWQLDATRQAYYYVLDDVKVPLSGERDAEWVTDTVLQVGEGILGQRFEPTPSPSACALCDYRIVCPAAER
jgi:DNA helicase-2/ATP-dependent DNA helicase PcrA